MSILLKSDLFQISSLKPCFFLPLGISPSFIRLSKVALEMPRKLAASILDNSYAFNFSIKLNNSSYSDSVIVEFPESKSFSI